LRRAMIIEKMQRAENYRVDRGPII
jgi:hypothetical protein